MARKNALQERLNEIFSDHVLPESPFYPDSVDETGEALPPGKAPAFEQPLPAIKLQRAQIQGQEIDYLSSQIDFEITEATTVGMLPLQDFQVDIRLDASLVDNTLRNSPVIVGVMVFDGPRLRGAISRRKFYEMMGRQFGYSVYLRRSIGVMLNSNTAETLIVPAQLHIAEAVKLALNRTADSITEPVLISLSDQYYLLDIYILLLAQAKLFVHLQSQLKLANEELEQRVQARTADLLLEIKERRRAETRLEDRLLYEKTLTLCADTLLTGEYNQEIIQTTLGYLNSAVNASRVFILENIELEDQAPGLLLTNQIHVDTIPPIPEHLNTLQQNNLGDWIRDLWSGRTIIGQVDEVPAREKALLQTLGFISVLLIPIGEPGHWVGVIGFGETSAKRTWDENDIQLLNTVAEMLYTYFERQRNSLALAQARDEAIQSNQFKSDLLAKVSHELRTPLSVILGYTQLLSHGSYGELSEDQKEAADIVVGSTKYLANLVNGILDQAQLESGQLSLVNAPYNLRQMADEVETRIRVLSESKGLQYICAIAPELPEEITGDHLRVEQVLTNLLGNAVKFTDTGRIEMRFSLLQAGRLAIAISDTGVGIPEEARQKIFEPFHQVDNSYTRRHSGTGLGLSISRQLVEMMGGDIRLESQIGQGSTFTIELPLQP